MAEELGFIGCFAIIALFAVLIWRGILTAMRAPDNFGSLLAVGITTLIGIQVIINIFYLFHFKSKSQSVYLIQSIVSNKYISHIY